ncbi:MAG TPA: hypothetical protein VFS58_09965 [Steroidobacteraceae bacterium]|nr:hypothetical protein [Steroidobacteraceae bacterium]
MNRRIPLMIGVAAAVAAAIAAVRLAARPPEPGAIVVADAPALRVALAAPSTPGAEPVENATAGQNVQKWIADTQSGDATTRAAAITALASAPRAEALPVLGRILTDGEPQADRPLALRSLRELALSQGDADGAIRDAVRNAIYHGDDHTRIDDVQETLDIIEESQQGQ